MILVFPQVLTQPQSLDYYLKSDAWTQYNSLGTGITPSEPGSGQGIYSGIKPINWVAIDRYIATGQMTERERDLLRAQCSAFILHRSARPVPGSMPRFPEWEAARKKYDALQVKTPLPPADIGDMGSGDYYGQVPPGSWGGQKVPPPIGDVPKLPPPGSPGAGDLAVNTKALALLRNNVLRLNEMIQSSTSFVELVNVRPGGFGEGFRIRDDINGRGESEKGLKWDTIKFMQNASNALMSISDHVGKLIIDYDNSEELNNLTTEKLQAMLALPFTFIDNSTNFGSVETGGVNGNAGGSATGTGSGSEAGQNT